MKKVLFLFLSISVSLTMHAQVSVKLASDVWPPFTNIDSEQAVALALVNEALSRSFVTADNHIVKFEEVIAGLKEGSYDGSAALWKTPERENYLVFSQPYMQNQLILVGRKGSDVSASTLGELAGKRIAEVSSYAYGDILKNITETELIQGESDQENLDNLMKGEVDFMLVDRLLIQYLLLDSSAKVEEYLEVGENTLLIKPLYFALRKDFPDAEGIIQRFNQEVVKMSADGTYNRLLKLNWITTDIDGDGRMEYVLHGNQGGSNAPENSYSVWFDQPSEPGQSMASQYYIDGKYYDSWNDVPDNYKKPVTPSTSGNFNFLSLKID